MLNSTNVLFLIDVYQEMKDSAGDLPDRSEIASFDQGKLKKVEMTEKNVLPDKSSMFLLVAP